MPRSRITPSSGIKMFESYTDFSAGLNSETSNERLRENEFPILENADLSGRGSVKRRTGRTLLQTFTGTTQGLGYYYRADQAKPDVVVAAGGKLYVYLNTGGTPFEVPIQNLGSSTFQTSRQIEMVQYNKTLYVATGTKFSELAYSGDPTWTATTALAIGARVQYSNKLYECTVAGVTGSTAPSHTSGTATNGTTTLKFIATLSSGWYAKVVEAYLPTQMEFIYIGTNALASDPTNYVNLTDELGLALTAKGIAPNKSTGAVNIPVTFTAFVTYTTTEPLAQIEYKWEYKRSDDTSTTWTLAAGFSGGTVNKSYAISFDKATNYDIKVSVKHTSGSAVKEYILTNYLIGDTSLKILPSTQIQTCTKVLLHWDRILLSGDTLNPYQVYISDLSAPGYFPSLNTITFDIGRQEPITSIVRYRDYLVVFTKTTIHALTGKSPDNYVRSLIHEGIGCIAEKTVKVTGNNIMFLSQEGIYQLRPNQLVLEALNVFRADTQIKSSIYHDTDACAMTYDSQYWISFPTRGVMYRYYYEQNAWVKDISSEIKFTHMDHYGSEVIELGLTGKLWKQDSTTYADGSSVYDMIIQTKYLDLSMSFNYKKLKKMYILAKHYSTDVSLSVKVEADSAIVLTPDTSHAEVVDNSVIWVLESTPNFHFYSGTTIGTWVLGVDPLGAVEISVQKANISGKCRRTRITFTHSNNVPCEIFGFGLEFKEKKV